MSLKLQGEISLDGSGWKKGLDSAAAGLNSLKSQLAAAFSVGAIASLTRKTIEYAGHINDLSDRLGVSTDYLQEMQYVMKQAGASVDDLAGSFEKLNSARMSALGGDSKSLKAFGKFGIGIADLQAKSNPQLMDMIAAQFKQLGSSPALVSAFREIGGRGAGALVPAFVSGLEEGRAEARAAGAVISEDVLLQIDEAGDKLDQLGMVIMANLAPALKTAVDFIMWASSQIKASFGFMLGFFGSIKLQDIIYDFLTGTAKGGGNPAAGMLKVLKSNAVQNAFNAGAQNVASADAEYQKYLADSASAIDAKRNARAAGRKFTPLEFTPTEQKRRSVSAYSDSLLSVGNFLGAGTGRTIEAIAQQQLQEQRKTNRILEDIKNSSGGTINVPTTT